MHWPRANANKSNIENKMFFDTVASAIILTNKGDEQGLAAKANTIPTKNGSIKIPPFLLFGIFFMIAGKCISSIPIRFSPKISITEANISITTGDATEVNALPDNAQITPIMLNTLDSPSEKDIICINNFFPLSFE